MSTITASQEQQVVEQVPKQLYIGGHWRDGAKGTLPVEDPSTGTVLCQVADASVQDAKAALDAAVDAGPEFAAMAPRDRGEILRRAFELITQRKQDLATLMTLEMGKTVRESLAEITYAAEFFRWFSEEAVRIDGRYAVAGNGAGRVLTMKQPVGPCLMITPWNFPLAMATRKIAPALAAGCTVVVKPASQTPLTTSLFVQLLEDAGVPAGVVNVINTSTSGPVSEAIISDPRLRKLSFTGSTSVGQRLLEQAAQGVLRTSMELGGNAPFIVFEDADLGKAVEGALAAKFRNTGEACTAANRFIVHSSIAEEFARRITDRVRELRTGRGTEDGVTIGPLIDERAVEKASELVRDAVDKGATLRIGGEAIQRPGTFFAATVLSDVRPGSQILREEIFGPVVAIVSFTDEDDAVRLANDTEFGLVSYVYTQNLARGQRMIERLETGMLGLNVGVVSNPAAPFGGWKLSGLGREGGAEGIHEYLQTKYTLTPDPFS